MCNSILHHFIDHAHCSKAEKSTLNVYINCQASRFRCKATVLYYIRKTSNISRTLVGNQIVDYSDEVGASPVGDANYNFILDLTPGFNGLGKGNCKMTRVTFKFRDLVHLILEI